MKLFTKCKNCKKEVSFKSPCGTRVELAMKEGENIMLSCKECHVKNKYFVNDIYAKYSKLINIVSTLIFLIGTPLIGYMGYKVLNFSFGVAKIAGLSSMPVIVYVILRGQHRARINTFNRGYL